MTASEVELTHVAFPEASDCITRFAPAPLVIWRLVVVVFPPTVSFCPATGVALIPVFPFLSTMNALLRALSAVPFPMTKAGSVVIHVVGELLAIESLYWPMANEAYARAVTDNPIAVEELPEAVVELPIEVELSPDAFVKLPIAVEELPEAVVELPIAVV